MLAPTVQKFMQTFAFPFMQKGLLQNHFFPIPVSSAPSPEVPAAMSIVPPVEPNAHSL